MVQTLRNLSRRKKRVIGRVLAFLNGLERFTTYVFFVDVVQPRIKFGKFVH